VTKACHVSQNDWTKVYEKLPARASGALANPNSPTSQRSYGAAFSNIASASKYYQRLSTLKLGMISSLHSLSSPLLFLSGVRVVHVAE